MATHEPTVLPPYLQLYFDSKRPYRLPHLFIDGIEHKHCHACEQDKPLHEFTKDKQRWDSYFLYCKDCKNAKKHVWNAAHVEEQRAYFKDYGIAHQVEKALRNHAYYLANREAILLACKQYRASHPEHREWEKRWHDDHREQERPRKRQRKHARRAKLATLPVHWTAATEAFALQYWHYTCAVCGRERELTLDIALDHWIPVASPACPGTIVGNMIPLCHGTKGSSVLLPIACNQHKGKKDPRIWLVERLGKVKARAKLKAIEAFFLEAERVAAQSAALKEDGHESACASLSCRL